MPLKVSALLATVTGSRRRTGAPRSQRGTRLKATTDRAFLVSAGFPSAGANTEEACPSFPGVRAGIIPNQSTAAQFGLSFLAPSRLHRAKWPERFDPRSFLDVSRRWGRLGGCYYDRTYTGISAQPT